MRPPATGGGVDFLAGAGVVGHRNRHFARASGSQPPRRWNLACPGENHPETPRSLVLLRPILSSFVAAGTPKGPVEGGSGDANPRRLRNLPRPLGFRVRPGTCPRLPPAAGSVPDAGHVDGADPLPEDEPADQRLPGARRVRGLGERSR